VIKLGDSIATLFTVAQDFISHFLLGRNESKKVLFLN